MSNRLNIYKVDDSGIKRLIDAILQSAIREWFINVKAINKGSKNESHIRELKHILSFIKSDYFRALTNGTCPQIDIINKLIETIKVKKIKDEIKKYSL